MGRSNLTSKSRISERSYISSIVGGRIIARVLALIICSSIGTGMVTGYKGSPLKELVVYQFENRVPPTTDIVIIASPSGNLTDFEVGTFGLFDHTLRLGMQNTSTKVGTAYGLATQLPNGDLFLTTTYVFNTSDLAGTINVQGVKDPEGTGVLAISGGSGDFSFIRGYDTSITVATVPTQFIYKNEFTIRY